MINKIELKTAEAIQDDVNKGIVRIDSPFQREIGVKPGDFVYIEGRRKIVAKVDRAYPGDYGLEIIRMDGIFRKNAGTEAGEYVTISKAEIKAATKIVLQIYSSEMKNKFLSIPTLKTCFMGEPVTKDDLRKIKLIDQTKMIYEIMVKIKDVKPEVSAFVGKETEIQVYNQEESK